MFQRFQDLKDKAIKPFIGEASMPAVPDRGWLPDPNNEYRQRKFENRGEQFIYFVTSGSTGYMRDGEYFDISGASISQKEYDRIIVTLGIEDEVGVSGKFHADDYWAKKGE